MTCFFEYGDAAWGIAHYAAIGALSAAALGVLTAAGTAARLPGARILLPLAWITAGLCVLVMYTADAIREHPLLCLCAACGAAGAILGWRLRGYSGLRA